MTLTYNAFLKDPKMVLIMLDLKLPKCAILMVRRNDLLTQNNFGGTVQFYTSNHFKMSLKTFLNKRYLIDDPAPSNEQLS